MYVIEQWNGLEDDGSFHSIVAGFPTLEEAAIWCYKQSPISADDSRMTPEEAFNMVYVSGENVNHIPYPWGGVPKDARKGNNQ
jgi:hypothetical protein